MQTLLGSTTSINYFNKAQLYILACSCPYHVNECNSVNPFDSNPVTLPAKTRQKKHSLGESSSFDEICLGLGLG